jgi:hypothetical protein
MVSPEQQLSRRARAVRLALIRNYREAQERRKEKSEE